MTYILHPLICVVLTVVFMKGFGGSEINITSELNLIKSQVTECLSFNKHVVEENHHQRNLMKSLVSKNIELEQKLDFMLNGSLNFPNVMPASRSGGFVGFIAHVGDVLSNIGDNQDIPFKDVLMNTNNVFHGDTGIFTSPRAGHFAFFVTLLVYPGKRVEYKIMKNGDRWGARGYSKGTSSSYGSSSISALFYLETGDKVWVRVNEDSHEGTGNMIFNNYYSTFKGFSLD